MFRLYLNDVQSSVTERAVPSCDTGTGGEAAAGSGENEVMLL